MSTWKRICPVSVVEITNLVLLHDPDWKINCERKKQQKKKSGFIGLV